MIKVTVTGVQGSGKTTLAEALAEEAVRCGYTVEVVEEAARNSPLPINEDATVLSQNYLFAEQLRHETIAEHNDCDIVICDRSILDCMVYYASMLKTHPEYNHTYFYPLLLLAQTHMTTYDLVARLPLNINRINNAVDDVRSKDIDFANVIDALFDYYIDPYVNTESTTVDGLMHKIRVVMGWREQQ